MDLCYKDLSLNEGRSSRARQERPHPPRMGATEGIVFKGRGREILFGMKGWRPSACPIGPKTGSGLVKRAYSCRTSDRSACLFRGSSVPGLMTRGLVLDAGFPFRAQSGSAADRSGRNRAQASATMKRRQPFTHLHETAGGTETKIEGPTMNPGANMPTPPLPRYLKPESASKRKKCGNSEFTHRQRYPPHPEERCEASRLEGCSSGRTSVVQAGASFEAASRRLRTRVRQLKMPWGSA